MIADLVFLGMLLVGACLAVLGAVVLVDVAERRRDVPRRWQ